jgi:hypothetical protein
MTRTKYQNPWRQLLQSRIHPGIDISAPKIVLDFKHEKIHYRA